ncbi:hypothetical protein [Propionicicella superfundia]|uniref:hypothetical protein n=1 Tax=Propionicicella superfundia TaxID=348582 RepID=UPI0003FE35DB|nr:hypothetical protein [Propionicicella superfundia]
MQIEASSTEYEQAKAHLDDCLTLAGDCHKLYMSIDDSLRRTCNQAFFETIWAKPDSDTVEGAPGTPFNVLLNPEVHTLALDHEAQGSDRRIQTENVAGLNNELLVDRGRLQPHEWKRVERLESVWELAKRGLGASGSTADSGLAGAVTEPKRRNRTPLTANQIDAIHTARDNGESIMSIARRFEVSRMTVWERTRTR